MRTCGVGTLFCSRRSRGQSAQESRCKMQGKLRLDNGSRWENLLARFIWVDWNATSPSTSEFITRSPDTAQVKVWLREDRSECCSPFQTIRPGKTRQRRESVKLEPSRRILAHTITITNTAVSQLCSANRCLSCKLLERSHGRRPVPPLPSGKHDTTPAPTPRPPRRRDTRPPSAAAPFI